MAQVDAVCVWVVCRKRKSYTLQSGDHACSPLGSLTINFVHFNLNDTIHVHAKSRTPWGTYVCSQSSAPGMHSCCAQTRQAELIMLRHGDFVIHASHKYKIVLLDVNRAFSHQRPACCWLMASGAKSPPKTWLLATCWCCFLETASLWMVWWSPAAAAWMSQP